MSLTRVKAYLGFEKPYNFPVAIAFVLSVLLLIAALAVFFVFSAKELVEFGTSRFVYFTYIGVLLFFAAVFARWYKASYCLIALAFIELTLGLATSALARQGIGFSALPHNTARDLRFDHHLLLQAVPTPNLRIDGKRGEVRHNALGLRGGEVAKDGQPRIFVYGGSSTYDVGVAEGETWVEQLNGLLGGKYAVLNLGVPGYSTAEHIIQTAFYGDINGTFPACAVYYIGWNDIRNAHVPGLDKAYADFHLPSQLGEMETRKVLRFGDFSPLFIVASRTLSTVMETAPYPKDLGGMKPLPGSDEKLEKIYLNNIQTISAINRSRNVPTVFIAQILNREALTSDETRDWFPLIKDKDVWALQERFNRILGEKAAELKDGFIDVGIDNFQDDDFVDEGHFSPDGAKKFARLVSNDLIKFCGPSR